MKNVLRVRLALRRSFTLPVLCALSLQGALLGPTNLQAANRVLAWGDINYDVSVTFNPQAVHGTGVLQISSGDFHSVALDQAGTVLAWGDNRFGQIVVPECLRNSPAAEVAAGNIHTLALTRDGSVVAWGPAPGQPGDYGQCAIPSNLGHATAVAAGAVHSLALTSNGTVSAWGLNLSGQCDVPADLNNVVAIAGGMYHSLALKADGTVVAWGDNRQGQTNIPEGLAHVVAIAAGGFHNAALLANGTVVTWGTYRQGCGLGFQHRRPMQRAGRIGQCRGHRRSREPQHGSGPGQYGAASKEPPCGEVSLTNSRAFSRRSVSLYARKLEQAPALHALRELRGACASRFDWVRWEISPA
jgi:alpha-tubulin suppressor-like RCC1 family protein